MAVRSVSSPAETVIHNQNGKFVITGHPGLRGLEFADRKHAERFLIRVRKMETDLERAMRDAMLAEN